MTINMTNRTRATCHPPRIPTLVAYLERFQ